MPIKYIPGMVIPYNGKESGAFGALRPMIKAADGLTLGQVTAITGLESSTIQNWVKRGFVAHPVNKKYHEHQIARILIISMLRDSLKIEEIGDLLRIINGSRSAEDGIISEIDLYECLCEILLAVKPDAGELEQKRLIDSAINRYDVKNKRTLCGERCIDLKLLYNYLLISRFNVKVNSQKLPCSLFTVILSP